MIKEAIKLSPGKYLSQGIDDTRTKKTGKKIKNAQHGRDALSPKFHVNLQYGLRWLHTSILLPLYANDKERTGNIGARAIPVSFQEVPPIPKPGKKETEPQIKEYKEAKKKSNLSIHAVNNMKTMRVKVDELGGEDKILLYNGDGSFCNKTIFKVPLERIIVTARCRKDAKLSFPAPEGGRRKYSEQKFTPEQVRKYETIELKTEKIFFGGKWRDIEYKEVIDVLWQRGGGTRRFRLFVLRPIPYRNTKKGRVLYRDPAYLLTTDTKAPAVEILQPFFDRWQVEVVHKEIKDTLGLGEAQVRVDTSVSRQPALVSATYSAMYLSALNEFGPGRSDKLGPLPKYQREKSRPSCAELIRYLRGEIVNNCLTLPFELNITWDAIHSVSTG